MQVVALGLRGPQQTKASGLKPSSLIPLSQATSGGCIGRGLPAALGRRSQAGAAQAPGDAQRARSLATDQRRPPYARPAREPACSLESDHRRGVPAPGAGTGAARAPGKSNSRCVPTERSRAEVTQGVTTAKGFLVPLWLKFLLARPTLGSHWPGSISIVLPFLEYYINGIIEFVAFWFWLLSLSKVLWKRIPVVALYWIYHNWFIHSPVGHLGCGVNCRYVCIWIPGTCENDLVAEDVMKLRIKKRNLPGII